MKKGRSSKSEYINKLYFGTKLVGTIALFEWILVLTFAIRRFLSLGSTDFYNKILSLINYDISKYKDFINNLVIMVILIFLIIGVIYITFTIINYILSKDKNPKIEKWLYFELFLAIIFMLLPFVFIIFYNLV